MADISDYQDRFDASAYAAAGHMVLGLKATEGVNWSSKTHGERADAAHSRNCAVFHYHFARGGDHRAEMTHFWNVVKPHWRKGDALVLDVEIGNPESMGAWAHNADNFLRGYSHHTPLGYCSESYLRPSFKIGSRHFWIAAYRDRSPAWYLGGGRTRKVWQYTDGSVGARQYPHSFAGIGECDGSVIGRRFARQIAKTIGR